LFLVGELPKLCGDEALKLGRSDVRGVLALRRRAFQLRQRQSRDDRPHAFAGDLQGARGFKRGDELLTLVPLLLSLLGTG